MQFFDFDEHYVALLREGDYRTQEHFVSYFSELMRIKLRSRLRSEQAIEDVRQETFSRVFAALRTGGGIREPERLGAFVNSTCNRVLLESYRSTAKHSSPEEPDFDSVPDQKSDTLKSLIDQQTTEHVHQVIDQLPERDKRLLREIFLEERDKDEVCREYGVDRDYLRVLLHRAKQSFRTLYLKRTGAVTAKGKTAKEL